MEGGGEGKEEGGDQRKGGQKRILKLGADVPTGLSRSWVLDVRDKIK